MMKVHTSYLFFLIPFFWSQTTLEAQVSNSLDLKEMTYKQQQHLIKNDIVLSDIKSARFTDNPNDLTKYLRDNLHYPFLAQEYCLEGVVKLGFLVEADGSILNIHVLEGLGLGCDEEAVHVLKQMPKWKPASLNQVPFAMSKFLYIYFKLE